jgi:hypothetical protein
MTQSNEPVGLDLTGSWRGQYTYPSHKQPVHFTATLTETAGWLVGAIEEIGTVGSARGLTITATVQGRRSGFSATFLKLYDGAFREYDTVHYAGDVNHDGTEIEGRWTIPGSWSGRFLMVRAGGQAEKRVLRITEKV